MKSRTLTCIIGMTLFAALAVTVRLAGQAQHQLRKIPHYKLTVLPTLGGTFSDGYGINEGGQVTGASVTVRDTVDAFVWQGGVIVDLGTLGGPVSIPARFGGHGINSRGMVAGFSNTSTPDPNGEDVCGLGTFLTCLPFIWQKGTMTALPLLGGNNGTVGGMNNREQIVGFSETPTPDSCSITLLQVEATIWEKGIVQELPPFPGDSDGTASDVNDKGQVAGVTGCVSTNTVRAVLWPQGPNGGVVDLGNLGGMGGNIPSSINNKGQVVGQSDLLGDTTHHAFLWQNGVMTDLGTLNGQPVSLAFGINNKGQIVGIFEDFAGDNTTGFLWQDGVMTDLNTLIPRGSPLFLNEPVAINDRGEIVGFGLDSSANERAFLLTPCNDDQVDSGDCRNSPEGPADLRRTNQGQRTALTKMIRTLRTRRVEPWSHIPAP